jgi:hypothetical protein
MFSFPFSFTISVARFSTRLAMPGRLLVLVGAGKVIAGQVDGFTA